MSWRKHFTPVNNSGLPLSLNSNNSADGYGGAMSRFESWLPEVYAGSPDRLLRYMQYDNMDGDPEINTALDTIAEFGTQEDEYTGLPFEVNYEETPSETESKIINKTLRQWIKLNDLNKRSFRIFRNTVKYGDQIFIRDPETYELHWVDPANVEKVLVNESEGKAIEVYYIKNLDFIFTEQVATKLSGIHNRPYGSGQGTTGMMSPQNTSTMPQTSGFGAQGTDEGFPVSAEHIVHISLTEGMDNQWPFGTSLLEPVFKVFKQKELLEDSIIIYRVHRAPERRVFFIDVGNMPPHKARQYLEQVKYEVQQKRIPGKNKQGQSIADSAYNPMCLDLTTRIPLLDGRTLELNELISEYQSGKENWVYSTDPMTGKVMPGNITWAGITRKNAKTIKITLDNDKEIVCTPDHKIPVLGKGFVEAKDLTPNDPLISFETRDRSLSNDKSRSYTQVFDHETNTWKYVHRMVAEFFRDIEKHQVLIFDEELKDLDKNTVHHKDYNRYNNNPCNLVWMSFEDHKRFHILNKQEYWENITIEEAERVKDKIRKGLAEYRLANPNWKDCYENHSEKIKSALANIDEEVRQEQFAKCGRSRAKYLENNPTEKEQFVQQGREVLTKNRAKNQTLNFTQDMLTKVVETVKLNDSNRLETINLLNNDKEFIAIMKAANPVDPKSTQNIKNDVFTASKLNCMYTKFGYNGWKDFKEKTAVYNHRIKTIEFVENRDVGTITVDFQERWHSHHTFAIEAGIFVKNSMLEDYFFAQTAEGRGSKVDTLPGGENLGQIDDLRYFNNKLLRGLRVPSSYLPTGPEDGSAVYNDGKVGVAYIQEYRFSKYVERIQRQIQESLDREFKLFLKYRGIEIDASTFYIQFNKPMNFSSYRDLQLDSERANLYGQVAGIPYLSNQFKLKKYLGLTEDEIKENEALWRQENDEQSDATADNIEGGGMADMGAMGMRAEPDEMLDMGAEADLSDIDMDAEMGGDIGGADASAPEANIPDGGI